MSTNPRTRPAQPADIAKIVEIYNRGIQSRLATFRTSPASTLEVAAWLEQPKHPLMVLELDGTVLGWAHASPYRTAAYYAGIAEYSIYLAEVAQGRGFGQRLLEDFILACAKAGLWKLVSRIFPENTASLVLCRKTGFREVGIYHKHAKLEGVWRDVVLVEHLIAANLD